MSRLIDADVAIENIEEWLDSVGTAMIGKGLSYTGELMGCIEDAPTVDAVHVVRCRKCKKKNKKKCPMTIVNFGRDGKEVLVQNHVPDDFYCAAGVRKEGADNDT